MSIPFYRWTSSWTCILIYFSSDYWDIFAVVRLVCPQIWEDLDLPLESVILCVPSTLRYYKHWSEYSNFSNNWPVTNPVRLQRLFEICNWWWSHVIIRTYYIIFLSNIANDQVHPSSKFSFILYFPSPQTRATDHQKVCQWSVPMCVIRDNKFKSHSESESMRGTPHSGLTTAFWLLPM